MKEKRKPAVIFTASTTSVTTWAGSPFIDGEITRQAISRNMAAKMLRQIRAKERQAT